MQNEKRKRFIHKIKVITDVLKQELNDPEILSPSEKLYLASAIEKYEDLYNKMLKV